MTEPRKGPPRVFISYSHDSAEHRQAVLALSNKLRQQGIDCYIDQYVAGFPAEGWMRWMRKQVESAQFVLMVCTPTYKKRYEGDDQVSGRGVNFEGVVIGQTLYSNFQRNEKFLPVIPDSGDHQHVPIELSGFTTYRMHADYEPLYRHITGQPLVVPPELGEMRKLDTAPDPAASANTDTAKAAPLPSLPAHDLVNPPTVTIDRLPTVKGDFFGREQELKLLDDALAGIEKPLSPRERGWGEGERPKQVRILQFIASGGTGKTKLLRHWLNQNEAQLPNHIVWSFYSQGSSEDKQVTSSPMFSEALKAYGLDETAYRTEEDKADALAEALIRSRCLLVLDGLEPLQHSGKGMHGRLKDKALARLLSRLLKQTQALCLITTRIEVHELSDKPHVQSHNLNNLSTADGLRLLKSLGVQGRDQDIKQAVTAVEGHALALHLLGNAVGTYLNGDILRRDTLPELMGEWDAQGRHAYKMLAAYEHWLREDPDDPQSPALPELRLLYLLGLFDHPIEISVLEALWREPIPGLTDGVPERAWPPAIRALKERHRLLSEHEEQPGVSDDRLDCHPLIREYFGRRLKAREPEGWRLAHERLYDHYRRLPDKEQPDSLDEMQPLFAAVAHGCAAGLHQRALHEVYWPRIKRKGDHYLTAKLGAFSDDLAVIAHFFARPWDRPAPGLSEADQAVVLSWVGFRLRALGRLREALEPMGASVEMTVKQEDWIEAAKNAGNLSELQLTLGEVDAALASGRDGVDYADRSGDAFQRISTRSTQADALHQAGEPQAAAELFQAAERMQAEDQPQYPRLYSLRGFRYCDLLLAQGRTGEALERAGETIKIAERNKWLLDIALDQLTQARAHLQTFLPPSPIANGRSAATLPPGRGAGGRVLLKEPFAIGEGENSNETQNPESLTTAAHWLEQAVAGLRASGVNDYLVRGLLTRAALHRLNGDHPAAHQDLDEVWDLAEPSGMRLHLTDYHLESARLALAEDRPDSAREHVDAARRLIEDTGYKRRLPELEALEEEVLATDEHGLQRPKKSAADERG